MILRNHRILFSGNAEFHVRPVGDLQWGAKGFDEELYWECWEQTVNDPNSITIGMGDWSDNFRPTIRERFGASMSGDVMAQMQMDDMHRDHMDKMIRTLKLEKLVKAGHGCLGLLDGHHFFRYANGETSTQYLCRTLKIPYLGEMSAFIRLLFQYKKNATSSMGSLVIHAQHGEGGAQYIASDAAKLERKTVPNFQADIYLRGHSTKAYSGGSDILYMSEAENPSILAKSVVWANTGGFMRGYLEGETTYVEKKMLAPAKLGYVVVNIKVSNQTVGGQRKRKTFRLSVTC